MKLKKIRFCSYFLFLFLLLVPLVFADECSVIVKEGEKIFADGKELYIKDIIDHGGSVRVSAVKDGVIVETIIRDDEEKTIAGIKVEYEEYLADGKIRIEIGAEECKKGYGGVSGWCEYFFDVNDELVVDGRKVTLINVGEGGAVLVKVNDVLDTVSSQSENVANGVLIKNIATYFTESREERSADLGFKCDSSIAPIEKIEVSGAGKITKEYYGKGYGEDNSCFGRCVSSERQRCCYIAESGEKVCTLIASCEEKQINLFCKEECYGDKINDDDDGGITIREREPSCSSICIKEKFDYCGKYEKESGRCKAEALDYCQDKCYGYESEDIPELGEAIFEKEVCDENECLFDDECIPIGVRAKGQYCSYHGEMLPQFGGGVFCENNFECVTNSCLDGQCTEFGFWQKFFKWFSRFA